MSENSFLRTFAGKLIEKGFKHDIFNFMNVRFRSFRQELMNLYFLKVYQIILIIGLVSKYRPAGCIRVPWSADSKFQAAP